MFVHNILKVGTAKRSHLNISLHLIMSVIAVIELIGKSVTKIQNIDVFDKRNRSKE